MKQILLLFALLAGTFAGRGQNVVLGERTPELKVTWQDDRRPAPAEATLLIFFLSANRSCTESLPHLHALAGELKGRLNVLFVTNDRPAEAEAALRPYAAENLFTTFDTEGKSFAGFGVNFVPFGVLIDRKGRALWMGNPRTLTRQTIEQNL